MQRIVSFDLSLAATGWALFGPAPLAAGEVKWGTIAPSIFGHPRLEYIRGRVLELCEGADLVVMEELAFSRNDPSAQERSGLAYLIRHSLWKRKTPFALIAPSSLKKFCTGKGNSPKEVMMMHVLKRLGHETMDSHQADAVALAYLGMALTHQWEPTMDAQRDVMKVVRASNPWLQKFVPWEVPA